MDHWHPSGCSVMHRTHQQTSRGAASGEALLGWFPNHKIHDQEQFIMCSTALPETRQAVQKQKSYGISSALSWLEGLSSLPLQRLLCVRKILKMKMSRIR